MIKNRIKDLCAMHGITIQKLEESAGIGNATITRWDKVSPKADSLEKVANYFNVSVDYLLCRTDDPTPQKPRLDDPNVPLVPSPQELALNEQEAQIKKKLEDLYDGMSEEDKKTAIAILEAIAAKGNK